MTDSDKKIYELLMQSFGNCGVVTMQQRRIWLVKSYYAPFRDVGKGFFMIDAYYPASNDLYFRIKSVLEQLNSLGISAERYKGYDLKRQLVISGQAIGCRRNSLAYDESGSRFVIGAIATAANGEDDSPQPSFALTDSLCSDCTRCIKACPTQALSLEGFDSSRCLRQYMTEGAYPNSAVAALAKNKLLGCDICQRVCPHNRQTSAEMPDELRQVLRAESFIDSLPQSLEVIKKYIGKNYAKDEWLKKLAEQLLDVAP